MCSLIVLVQRSGPSRSGPPAGPGGLGASCVEGVGHAVVLAGLPDDWVALEVGVGVGELGGQAGVVVAVAGVQVTAEAAGDLVNGPVAELMTAEGGRGLQVLQQLAVAGVGLAGWVWWPVWGGV